MAKTKSTFFVVHKKLDNVGLQFSLNEKVNLYESMVDIIVPQDGLPDARWP